MAQVTARVRAVFFDLDDTLVDATASVRAAARDALRLAARKHQLPLDPLVASFAQVIAEWLQGSVLYRFPLRHLRAMWFEQTLWAFNVKDGPLVDRMVELYGRRREESTMLFSDVEPALARLSGLCEIGIISDGLEEFHGRIVARLGLGRYVRHVILAGTVGVSKPHRRIFEVALARVPCEPSMAVHVGDSLERDVAGAKGAGMYAVWLNREAREGHLPAVRPDLEVTSLTALVDLLPGLGRR